MTFLAGWALAGLALLAPLVILHLRRRNGRVQEVPSLLLWQETRLESLTGGRPLALPPLPLLLLLQALALIALVVALAEPSITGQRRGASTVIVLDDSYWTSAPGVLSTARQEVDAVAAALPGGTPVSVVLADGAPHVIYRGSAAGLRPTVARVTSSLAGPTLGAALNLAAGLLTGPNDRVVLVHATDDPVPAVRAGQGTFTARSAGASTPDVGIFTPSARCGIGSPASCEVLAALRNTGAQPATVTVVMSESGRADTAQSVRVPARGTAEVVFTAGPGQQVVLRLTQLGPDALSADNRAWVAVPGDDDIPRSAAVTVVGTPAQAKSLAQAFAAVPGVNLRLEIPAHYRAGVARMSDLVVLDGRLPRGMLPPAAAVLLVDPSRLPGGHVGSALANTTLSGSDSASPLLSDADLSSLEIQPGAARRLTLPHWLSPVLWSPSGPLLAAGDAGHGRLIVTGFQPGGSTLAQLSAFPVLAANIVRWSLDWAPQSAVAGGSLFADTLPGTRTATLQGTGTAVQRIVLKDARASFTPATPGVYTLDELGPGVAHQATIDVNLGTPAASADGSTPIDLQTARIAPERAAPTGLIAWLLVVAAVILAAEWLYWAARRPRVSV